MKKKFILVLSTLLILPTTFINHNETQVAEADMITSDENTALATAQHIRNNLSEFNQERAKEGYLTAVTSFTTAPISVYCHDGEDVAGLLLDFDGDKGYMVVGPNMKFYDLQYVGNSPVPMALNISRFFSTFEGYSYIDETGIKVEIGFPNEPENDTQEETWYDGQYAAGESKIYDVQAYNDDKYGTRFEYRKEHSIRAASIELTSYLDSDLTLYYRFENYKMYYPKIDDYTCGYMIGKYIAFKINHLNYKSTIKNMTYSPATAEPTEYNYMTTQFGMTALATKDMSFFEFTYRQRVIADRIYDDLLTPSQTVGVLEHIYGDEITHVLYDGADALNTSEMIDLDNDNPLLFEFTNSAFYGERVLVVCGYKLYTRVIQLIGITRTDYRFYLEYKDGYSTHNSLYIDLTYCLTKCGSIYAINTVD